MNNPPSSFGTVLEWSGPTVKKLCSGQGNPDVDDDATADESNPYLSPFQATQKHHSNALKLQY